MQQVTALLEAIEQASSLETAELNTLRAGAYLTQALNDGLIARVEYDRLTGDAIECLRVWAPPL